MKRSIRSVASLSLLLVGGWAFADPARAAEPGFKTEPYVFKNVEIVGGGFVSGIIFSPAQKDLLYARTDIGGPYRWDPQAKRWIPLVDWASQKDWNLYGGESIGVDPVDPNRVYVAAGMYTHDWAGNASMLRSNDQGRTFQRTDLPFKMGGNEEGRSTGERLAVDPNQDAVIYFGSRDNGLWRSTDFAATWAKVDSFPVTGRTNGVGIGWVVFDRASGSNGKPTPTIYVGVSAPKTPIYRSTDAGATWQPVPGQPAGFLPHHGVLDADGTLYVSYGNHPGPNGMTGGAVYKLDTKSGAWTDITPVNPHAAGEHGFGYAGLAIDAQHPGTVMVASMDRWNPGDDIFRTTDGGKHWASLKARSERDSSLSPFLNWGRARADLGHWIGALAIDPFDSGHVLYGTGATIWTSDDADKLDHNEMTHWAVGAAGLEETAIIDLISPPAGAHLISGLGDIGGFRHDDLAVAPRGGLWTNPVMSNTDCLDFAERKPERVVRVGRGENGKEGAISEDGAATWKPFAGEPLPGRSGGGSVAISADGATIVWAPNRAAPFYSRDGGATWNASSGAPAGAKILSDRVNAQRFYAIDAEGDALLLSDDGGATFTSKNANLPEDAIVRVVPGNEGDLWMTAQKSGLSHSTDGGASFKKLDDVAEAFAVGFGKSAPGRSYPAVYLVATIDGVTGAFRSDDAGATWVRINDDQHQYGWMRPILGDPRIYGRVYFGTNGRGILYGDPAAK